MRAGGPLAEHRGEPLPAREDAAIEQFAVIGEKAELTLAFVAINSYAIHGWPPGGMLRH